MLSNRNILILISAFVLMFFITACPANGLHKASEIYTLNTNEPVYSIYRTQEFRLFSGKYPSSWPAWLELPKNSYLAKDGEILTGKVLQTGSLKYSAHAISSLNVSDTKVYFKKLLDDNHISYKESTVGAFQLIVHPGSTSCYLSITIDALQTDSTHTYYRVIVRP